MTTAQFGERVRERRLQEGLSQVELAEKVGISRTYLSEIERGVATNLSWKVVERLTAELGLPVEKEGGAEDSMENLPPGLAEFAKSKGLPPQDIVMLARLKFRGKQPMTPDRWELLYNVIEMATR